MTSHLQIDELLARRLVANQFPRWSGLPLHVVDSLGTDNALFRLGGEMCLRFPKAEWAVLQVEKELRWLPEIAPRLPFPIPKPIAGGQPTEDFPWPWSVYEWLPGVEAVRGNLANPSRLATDLASFVRALRRIDATGGPAAGEHNFHRGVALVERDSHVRKALIELKGAIDTAKAAELWESALEAPRWDGPPVWVHGDLQPSNLLLDDEGRLSAVIDFGGLGIGDPAVDLIPAWNTFDAGTRELFRSELDVDDSTWRRGIGWALSVALIALPYYRETNRAIAELSKLTIEVILAHNS